VDLDVVARGTPGFSGADLVNEAAINAVRDNREVLSARDFDAARDRIILATGSGHEPSRASSEHRRGRHP
jgi:cell division protease FtsH